MRTNKPTKPVRLLAVEDSEIDAELTRLELRRRGFDVHLSRVDTRDTLAQALDAHEWDLVVCDFGLPGFDSMEALAMVLAHDSDLPFVVVSGTIGEEATVTALHAGARDVVIKTNLSRLGAVTDRELHAAQARRGHRAAEQALHHSQARHRAILLATLDALLAVDHAGCITEANPAAGTMFGSDLDRLLGRSITELLPIADLLGPHPTSDGADGDHGRRIECTAARVNGQSFPAEVAIATGALPTETFWTLSIRDLTQRKRAEAENQALQSQLLQSQKMEAMGRLAAGITHDFNNIVNIIVGYSDLALKRSSDQAIVESLEAINDAGHRGGALAQQLLAFARQQVLNPVIVDLNQLLGELRPMLHMVLRPGHHLSTRFASGLRPIRADPHQLGQVVLNLVANAVDAMPHGGTITLHTENLDVTAAQRSTEPEPPVPTGRYAMLSVSDTGIGIDTTTQARIFDPFFTTKGSAGGTGLGLATALGIVSQSNGHMSVKSEPGTGATFNVYLPSAGLPTEPDGPAPRLDGHP